MRDSLGVDSWSTLGKIIGGENDGLIEVLFNHLFHGNSTDISRNAVFLNIFKLLYVQLQL